MLASHLACTATRKACQNLPCTPPRAHACKQTWQPILTPDSVACMQIVCESCQEVLQSDVALLQLDLINWKPELFAGE